MLVTVAIEVPDRRVSIQPAVVCATSAGPRSRALRGASRVFGSGPTRWKGTVRRGSRCPAACHPIQGSLTVGLRAQRLTVSDSPVFGCRAQVGSSPAYRSVTCTRTEVARRPAAPANRRSWPGACWPA